MVVLGRRHRIRERERERERRNSKAWDLGGEQRSSDLGFKRSLTEITFGVWTPLMGPVRPLYFASSVYQHQNLQSLFFFQTLKMR